ncbi:unnamed protein product [Thelazia callipaeda]|uniref:Uncharacterized protein n=1 Tax=Thelazia callipaeda TaxID=103827 RepID=A0A0N5CLJ7_THECL|nr:unnamed protein product [Thelazia callipaeda]
MDLKAKIAAIDVEIFQLRKRRNAYLAKMQLMEEHVNTNRSKKKSSDETNSSDESFSTTELFEMSLSSVSSSILGSQISFHTNENESECDDNLEKGHHSRMRHKKDKKSRAEEV